MWVYLAGRYSRREELLGYAAEIDRAGHETCSTWVAGSHELPEGWDQAGQFPKAAETFAREDLRDLGMADVVICFTDHPLSHETHGGHHVELGLGLGLGKHGIIVGPKENIFHDLPRVCHFSAWGPEVIEHLDALYPAMKTYRISGLRKETKAQERARRLAEAMVLLRQGMDLILGLYGELEELRDNLENHFSQTDRFEAIEAALETLEPVTAIDPDELEGVSFEWEPKKPARNDGGVYSSNWSRPMSQLTHGGHHVELGIGLGLGQHLAIVGPRENVFHTLPYVPHFFQWGPDVITFLDTLEQDLNTPWVFKVFKKLVTMISPNGETLW